MPERLAHRDLRNDSSRVLREVESGASFEVTNHGRVVALLLPVSEGGDLRVRPASSTRPFSEIDRVARPESTTAALDDLRGER